jgi:hypothetical protein
MDKATTYYEQYIQNFAFDDDYDVIKTMPYGYTGSAAAALKVDSDGHLQVDVLSGGGGGSQYEDGDAVAAGQEGNVMMGTDGSNLQFVATDSSGNVQVDVLTGPSGGQEVVQDTAADLNCTEASAAAIKTAVEIMDDWDDGSNNCNTVSGYPNNGFSATINSADATSATQVKAAAGASTYIYITDIIVSTDTAMNFKIQDDEGTPGVLIQSTYVAANGGFVANFATPIKQPTANADIDVLASASGNISVTINGYTGT